MEFSMEQLNAALDLAGKLGLITVGLRLFLRWVDWVSAKVQETLNLVEQKGDEYKLLKQTKVDNVLWATLRQLSDITFKTIKDTLKEDLADGKIDRETYVKALHQDVKKNFKLVVSPAKQELFKAAMGDIPAVIDVLLPGVVKEAKDEARLRDNLGK